MTQSTNPAPGAGNQKTNLMEVLRTVQPAKLADQPMVADRFRSLYQTFHGSSQDAERYYLAEKFHFAKILSESQSLQNCDRLSIYGCLLDLCVNGLSLDPNLKQAYLVPRKGKATLVVSAYGELHLRKRSGQIKHVDNPVLVFEGDKFLTGTTRGGYFVEHEASYPRKSDKVIACYLKITRADGTVDYKVLSIEEVEKLRSQSEAPNSPAWTKNFWGMVQTKTIKHAFRNYEKVRSLGNTQFTQLETDLDEVVDQSVDIYGLGGGVPPTIAPQGSPEAQGWQIPEGSEDRPPAQGHQESAREAATGHLAQDQHNSNGSPKFNF